jgi:predicted dehydrogenase
LIGAGPWGCNYTKAIGDCVDAALVAIVSHNPATASRVASGCAVFAEAAAMLDSAELDGVVLAVPPAVQVALAPAILARRLAVLFEKPLALALVDAEALRAAAVRAGVVAQVDHIDLVNPAWQAVRAAARAGGAVKRIAGAFAGNGPFRACAGRWDWGAHAMAVSLDLMGRAPDRIAARRLAAHPPGELVEATLEWGAVAATLTFGNGADATSRWLEIETTAARYRYDDKGAVRAAVDGRAIACAATRPLDAAVERFVRAIRAGRPEARDLDLGVHVVQALAGVDAALGAAR